MVKVYTFFLFIQRKDVNFKFPNLFPSDYQEKSEADYQKIQDDKAKREKEDKKNMKLPEKVQQPGVPAWFS